VRPLGGESRGQFTSRFSGEFWEEGEDRRRSYEESEGGAESESSGVSPTAHSQTADYLAAKPDSLPGSVQFHLAAEA